MIKVIVLIEDKSRENVYKSGISDVRGIACDLSENAGWSLYFIGRILAFVKKPAFMEEPVMFRMMAVPVWKAIDEFMETAV